MFKPSAIFQLSFDAGHLGQQASEGMPTSTAASSGGSGGAGTAAKREVEPIAACLRAVKKEKTANEVVDTPTQDLL